MPGWMSVGWREVYPVLFLLPARRANSAPAPAFGGDDEETGSSVFLFQLGWPVGGSSVSSWSEKGSHRLYIYCTFCRPDGTSLPDYTLLYLSDQTNICWIFCCFYQSMPVHERDWYIFLSIVGWWSSIWTSSGMAGQIFGDWSPYRYIEWRRPSAGQLNLLFLLYILGPHWMALHGEPANWSWRSSSIPDRSERQHERKRMPPASHHDDIELIFFVHRTWFCCLIEIWLVGDRYHSSSYISHVSLGGNGGVHGIFFCRRQISIHSIVNLFQFSYINGLVHDIASSFIFYLFAS